MSLSMTLSEWGFMSVIPPVHMAPVCRATPLLANRIASSATTLLVGQDRGETYSWGRLHHADYGDILMTEGRIVNGSGGIFIGGDILTP